MKILAFIICILLGIGLLDRVTQNAEDDFQEWFRMVLDEAPAFGYEQQQIEDFQECDWMVYYHDGMNPLEALTRHSV